MSIWLLLVFLVGGMVFGTLVGGIVLGIFGGAVVGCFGYIFGSACVCGGCWGSEGSLGSAFC